MTAVIFFGGLAGIAFLFGLLSVDFFSADNL